MTAGEISKDFINFSKNQQNKDNELQRLRAEIGRLQMLIAEEAHKNNVLRLKYEELKASYDELNDYTSNQAMKLLEENEEPQKQRMTNRQLCEWYNRGNGQWKWKDSLQCHTDYSYSEEKDNNEVDETIHIRSWDSDKWVEPTVDIYKRDCKK